MPNIADVAQVAGVSTATVSRVLNDHPRVDPALAARVRRAAASLHYRPSAAARTLRTRRSRVWSLVVADIRNPFSTEMLRGVEDVAYRAGFALILCNANEDSDREAAYLRLALTEQVSGVILVPVSTAQPGVSELQSQDVPVVTVDRRSSNPRVDRVVLDNVGAARAAVEHLLEGGSRRIACITGPASTTTGTERLQGYLEALEAAHLEPGTQFVAHADFREAGGQRSAEQLLALNPRPDAFLVTNNQMTIGALRAVAAAGLRVPHDVAVVGFGDHPWTSLLDPPLTTVVQPTYDLGREAGQLLMSRLNGYAGEPREVLLSATLQVRGSSIRSVGGKTVNRRRRNNDSRRS